MEKFYSASLSSIAAIVAWIFFRKSKKHLTKLAQIKVKMGFAIIIGKKLALQGQWHIPNKSLLKYSQSILNMLMRTFKMTA